MTHWLMTTGIDCPADLAQDTDLHTQVEPAFRAFDDPPVRVMLRQERPVEHFGQPQSEAQPSVPESLKNGRTDSSFMNESNGPGIPVPAPALPARTGHVAHHVEEPFDGSEDEFFGNVPAPDTAYGPRESARRPAFRPCRFRSTVR